MKSFFHTRIQKGHRVKRPAWFLLRHQLRVGDILPVSIEKAEYDVRLGVGIRFAAPRREYEALNEYWLEQPVLRVDLEFEECPGTKLAIRFRERRLR
jgi:hypothetical protein